MRKGENRDGTDGRMRKKGGRVKDVGRAEREEQRNGNTEEERERERYSKREAAHQTCVNSP